ncbi:hypothetical protein F4678DRAFT_259886 [Xylaria arbuscula]|nr:hypothetical protein F4678DRAFT_259886 [Xylaria arbuscula]
MFSRRRTDPTTHPHPDHHHHHHHYHHHHHHHSRHRPSSPVNRHDTPEEDSRRDILMYEGRIQINLFDIDAPATGRPPVLIGARRTSTLENIARFLKDRFDQGAERVSPDDRIEFFHQRVQLHGNDLPKGSRIIWYRVINPQDNGLFKVKCGKTYDSVYLRQSQLDELAREIKSGATVGRLRVMVATYLREDRDRTTVDSDQIVIEAVGGFRPGPIQGDNWECKRVAGWVCRHLTIRIAPPGEFYVFYGLNERYVLHKPNIYFDGTKNGLILKTNFKFALLHTVCQTGDRLDTIGTDDINLYYRHKPVKDHTRFHPGKFFDFELSREAESAFVEAEAWLLAPTKTCTICAEEKRVSEMPTGGIITKDCGHTAWTCKECISQWITSSMETVAWNRLRCPECPKFLTHRDVEKFATRDISNRYDKLATKAALEETKGFRWCLNPKCDAGQIFSSRCEKAKCHACKHSACIRHDIPWHSGETCNEYDRRTRKQRQSYKLSEKHIKETTKPCPGCKKNVNKDSGCDHMTCVCGHEWCWLCFAEYTRDGESFLHCKHTRGCRYHTEPPFWEGRRALEQFLDPGGGQVPGFDGFDGFRARIAHRWPAHRLPIAEVRLPRGEEIHIPDMDFIHNEIVGMAAQVLPARIM